MPWLPELFSAPALQQLLDRRRREGLVAVPYFDGLLMGDPEPLVGSFAGTPEVHDPVSGRVKGEREFRAFVARTHAWLVERNVTVEDVEHAALSRRGFEEVVVHLDGDAGPIALPLVLVADRRTDGKIEELRLYYSAERVTGRDGGRPPLLQPDAALAVPEVIAEHQRAVAVGGGVQVENCALLDSGRACAMEYNIVRSGDTPLAPQAGVAVYVRDDDGGLTAVRAYDHLTA
jgi:hypothetical protein